MRQIYTFRIQQQQWWKNSLERCFPSYVGDISNCLTRPKTCKILKEIAFLNIINAEQVLIGLLVQRGREIRTSFCCFGYEHCSANSKNPDHSSCAISVVKLFRECILCTHVPDFLKEIGYKVGVSCSKIYQWVF